MTLSAPGYLNITTDVSMNGKSIDMSGGSFKKVNYTDMSLNGNTIDMVGGAIIRVGNQNFQTNIDIKQAGVSRIYTSGGTDMTIAPSGNLIILSDLSLNGNTLDMGTGGIITAPVKLTLNPIKNVDVLSDVSMNGNTLDMGSGVITATTNLTLDPVGNVNLVGNTLNMGSGNIIDVSGIYGVSNKNMRIDASSVTFTNNAITHMVIDNCGIILNDISYGNTGTVLTFNTTSNRVSYLPFYYSDVYDISLAVGNGGTNHKYSMNVSKIYDNVTIRIPDVSCIPSAALPIMNVLMGTPSIDVKYRPSNVITLPVTIYELSGGPSKFYRTGKIKFLTDGSMNVYVPGFETDSWSGTESGMPGQCFTYTV
jgi:hypothetical protein